MLAAGADSRVLARLAAAQQLDRQSAAGKFSVPLEEGTDSRVERIEGLAKPQGVKLVTALLHRLRQRRSQAASLVAQQTQQPDSRSTQQGWRIEVGRYIRVVHILSIVRSEPGRRPCRSLPASSHVERDKPVDHRVDLLRHF